MVSIGALADEICRISRIADALVLRFLGIRAERPVKAAGRVVFSDAWVASG